MDKMSTFRWVAVIAALLCVGIRPSVADTESMVEALAEATQAEQIQLSPEQQQSIREKTLTAALAWHGASPWISAVNRGAKDTFEAAGVRVLVTTDAQYDPAKQVADIENIQALSPDMLLSLVIDGVSARSSYKKVVEQGAQLVLLSNPIPGFELGKDFAGIVTDDMQGMGRAAADAVAGYLQQKGKLGVIYHDANYFITNTRDNAFLSRIAAAYPAVEVTAKQGFVKEHDTSSIASAMLLRYPDIEIIYVSWDAAAEGVLEALRNMGRNDIKVVSHDLGVNNLLDMARGSKMLASVADHPYQIGASMAKVAMLAELGEQTPLFTLVPYTLARRNNIQQVWEQAYQEPLPRIIELALKN